MKKNKRNEALKQGIQPAARALSDDDLMDVTGGVIFWRRRPGGARNFKQYGVLHGDRLVWYGSVVEAAAACASWGGQSTRLARIDD